MSNARNLARLLPNSSGLLPDANLAAIAASKLSGQVAYANAPSGSIIQTVSTPYNGSVATNSSTPVHLGAQISITTKLANSKILVSLSAPVQVNNGANCRFALSWRSSVDNYASDVAVYPAVIEGGWYELPSHLEYYHSPSQPAGTTITYKLYVSKQSGSGYLYLIDSWGYAGGLPIVAMEIV